MILRRLASRIKEAAMLEGGFVLRSGATSNIYFDKYRFEAEPRLLHDICSEMVALIPPNTEVLAGLELGGIPLVTLLSQLTSLPAAFVRKSAKSYGTCRLAEGAAVSGCRTLLVEDVVSSGGAIIDAAKALREEGAQIEQAICVIDRRQGRDSRLENQSIHLTGLFAMDDQAELVEARA